MVACLLVCLVGWLVGFLFFVLLLLFFVVLFRFALGGERARGGGGGGGTEIQLAQLPARTGPTKTNRAYTSYDPANH